MPKGRYRLFGIVMDLSSGGLAVESPGLKVQPMEKVEYALSIPHAGLRLERIQMAPVSDAILADHTDSEDGVCHRRGFCFGPMSPAQQERLHRILQSYTDVSLLD